MVTERQPLWWVEATATATGAKHRILVQGSDAVDAERNGVSKLSGRVGEVRMVLIERAADDAMGGLGRGGPRRRRARLKVVTRSGLIVGHGDTEAEAIASVRPEVRHREDWRVVRATSAGPDGRGPGAPLPAAFRPGAGGSA